MAGLTRKADRSSSRLGNKMAYPQETYPQATYPQDPNTMSQQAFLQMLQGMQRQKQAPAPAAPPPQTQQAMGLLGFPGGFNPNARFGQQGVLDPQAYQSSITMRGF